MFVGHIGAGLAMKRIEPRLNLGALLLAAMFADALLWLLVLLGVESVGAPVDTGRGKFFTFVFPYSHGLAASLVWSALAVLAGWFGLAKGYPARARLACMLGLTLFSHFVLDVIDHVPEMPLLGQGSPKLGLGLWQYMPAALALELGLAAAGLATYLARVRLSKGRRTLVTSLVLVTAVMTAAGPYAPGPLPPANALAAVSLAIALAVTLVGFFVERRLGLAEYV